MRKGGRHRHRQQKDVVRLEVPLPARATRQPSLCLAQPARVRLHGRGGEHVVGIALEALARSFAPGAIHVRREERAQQEPERAHLRVRIDAVGPSPFDRRPRFAQR